MTLVGTSKKSPFVQFNRLLFAAFTSSLLLVGQAPNALQDIQTSSRQISGEVIDQLTNAPVTGARLAISNWTHTPKAGKRPNYSSAETDAQGSFVLRDVPTGKYIVSASKEGYVNTSCYVTVRSDKAVDVRFVLPRLAIISGRVVDANRRGVPELQVGAWINSFRYGRSWTTFRGSAFTNQDGSYQIKGLRWGEYVVGVIPGILHPRTGVPSQAESHRLSVYTKNFYSDSPSMVDATTIHLEQGQHATGIDIPFHQTNGYCITALLPDLVPRNTDIAVSVVRSGSHTGFVLGTGVIQLSHHFHFCGVPEGDYVLDASVVTNKPTTSWAGWEDVTVDKSNITADVIPLQRARELHGRIVLDEGQLIHQQPPSVGIQLEPVDRLPFADEDVYPQFGRDGSFVCEKLFSGKYWVNLTGIAPGYYVKAISAGSHDGLTEPVMTGEGELTITVRSDGPTLSGVVTVEDGRELPPNTSVMLADASSDSGPTIRGAPADQTGRFSFDNLAPGKYSILAISGLNPDDRESPLVFRRLSSQATELNLSPYSSQQISLHPIPAS